MITSAMKGKVTRARNLALGGDAEKAVSILRGVVTDVPEFATAWQLLAETLLASQDLAGAQQAIDGAKKQGVPTTVVLSGSGLLQAYHDGGDLEARGAALVGLATVAPKLGKEAYLEFLRDTHNVSGASKGIWLAKAHALVGLGVSDQLSQYFDAGKPDYTYISVDVRKYLHAHPLPSNEPPAWKIWLEKLKFWGTDESESAADVGEETASKA